MFSLDLLCIIRIRLEPLSSSTADFGTTVSDKMDFKFVSDWSSLPAIF
jgi:hypothetical protein